jgi:RNA polymerase sigma factor FliA
MTTVNMSGEAQRWREFIETRAAPAREALFVHYFAYARALAAQLYAGRHRDDVDFKDFCQLALIGLIEAIDRYEPDRGSSFETFCTPRIRGCVLDGVKKLTDAQEQISFMRRMRRERVASLAQETVSGEQASTFPALAELTAGLAIGYMLDDTGMLADIEDRASPLASPWQGIAWRQTKERLVAAVNGMPDRDRKIITYHYFNGLRFDQIADLLGVTRARISQLHRAALLQLREQLGNRQRIYILG